jgi:hypothetical protein
MGRCGRYGRSNGRSVTVHRVPLTAVPRDTPPRSHAESFVAHGIIPNIPLRRNGSPGAVTSVAVLPRAMRAACGQSVRTTCPFPRPAAPLCLR